jgi:hypothetical protein
MGDGAAWSAIDRYLSVSAGSANLGLCRETTGDAGQHWLRVAALANAHFVVPALWTTLGRPELRGQLPDDVQDYFALLHQKNAARNARIRLQCLEIGSALAEAGLRAVLLKGVAWLFDGSAAVAADRMMRDIDLLVLPNDVDAAVATLLASGYRDTSETFVELGHFHHAALLPAGGEASVEIHRDLAHRIDLLPTREMISSATEVAPGLLLPTARHRIVHNVIHAQIGNGDWAGGLFSLRDGLDLARLMMRHESEIDWPSLAADARKRGFYRHLSGAIHLAHRSLGAPLPAPFATSAIGKLHAWRCLQQRRWLFAGVAETIAGVARGLAWERDAYGLKLNSRWSLRAQLLVNARRAWRAADAIRRPRTR